MRLRKIVSGVRGSCAASLNAESGLESIKRLIHSLHEGQNFFGNFFGRQTYVRSCWIDFFFAISDALTNGRNTRRKITISMANKQASTSTVI
jgi:hypothetical protein